MASLPNAVPLHSGLDVDSDWRAALMDVGIPYDIVADVDARGGAGLGGTTRGGATDPPGRWVVSRARPAFSLGRVQRATAGT